MGFYQIKKKTHGTGGSRFAAGCEIRCTRSVKKNHKGDSFCLCVYVSAEVMRRAGWTCHDGAEVAVDRETGRVQLLKTPRSDGGLAITWPDGSANAMVKTTVSGVVEMMEVEPFIRLYHNAPMRAEVANAREIIGCVLVALTRAAAAYAARSSESKIV